MTSHVEIHEIEIREPTAYDILFVVDDSPSMAAHRGRILANALNWFGGLATIPGGLPNLHLGVITTDLGSDGVASSAGCAGDGDGGVMRIAPGVARNYLVDEIGTDGMRLRNYDGELVSRFTELLDVGSAGCAFPRPLEAMRRALDGHPANAGFLRDRAFLEVVFVTATDDCSFASPDFIAGATAADSIRCFTQSERLATVDGYAEFLRTMKGEHQYNVVVGGAIGMSGPVQITMGPSGPGVAPACSVDGATATPANRIHTLLDAFPGRNTSTTICQDDLSGAFSLIPSYAPPAGGDPCFAGQLQDHDPTIPGVQLDCDVVFRSGGLDEPVPRCTSPAGPALCWSLVSDPADCPFGDHTRLASSWSYAPQAGHLIAQCVVESLE